MARTIAGIALWQALVIAGCVAVAVISGLALALLGRRPELLVVNLTAYSLSYLVAGAVAWIRRPGNPVGPVMLAISAAGGLSFFTLHPEPLVWRTAGVLGSVSNILIVWVMLAAPSGRLVRGVGRLALAGFGLIVLSVSVISDLSVLRVVFGVGVLVSLLLAAIVLRRWMTASGASRRALTPVAPAGLAIAIVHAVDFLSGVLLIPVTPGGPIYWAVTVSRALVPFGFLLGLLRMRMARAAVADLVLELGETAPPERLRSALASALGDPSMTLLSWSPGFRAYLDQSGTVVDPEADPAGRATTYLEHGGRRLGAILHDPSLSDEPGLVTAVGAAIRLAVDNERLAAEVRSQLDEVRASRARIVQASDAERRRVERNLHDGAQQRLVALSLALRRAQAQLSGDAAPQASAILAEASQQLAAAMTELRELAKGIHPAILTEAGLGAALRALAHESPVAVAVRVAIPEQLPEAVSGAAYFVAAEGLTNVAKYASAASAELIVEADGDVLRVEIVDDGVGGADAMVGSGLRGLSDRVAALGGHLDVRSPVGEGTRVVARLPLTAAAVEIG